ncbi:hypothetical protein FGO68_gene9614 [Halteria grandinella]|uniref:Phosphatidic acid phosphatase type 2/haloperoxidase domain-containing protein n=1 Tax=Halteria grandinella TaxID=5974 RepID=A0A8J8SWK8_HALGN|nr:hypothetical protein FGO68_gene9614 [Halteria grandinella]
MGLMLTMTIIFSVGFSRVALGVHSMNQVLYGWSYGAWVALFLFKFVRPHLRVHINELHFHQQYLSYYLFRALLIWLVVITFSFFNYIVAKRDFIIPPPQLWLDNMLLKCNLAFDERKMFVSPAFIKMGLVSSPLGAYMGLLIDAKLFNGRTEQGAVKFQSEKMRALGRLGLSFVMISPLLVPYFMMRDDYSVLTQYICRTSVPFCLLFLFLFGFSKQVFTKYGLL